MAFIEISDSVLAPRSPLAAQTLRGLRDNITRIERGAPITIQSIEQGTTLATGERHTFFDTLSSEIAPPIGKIFLKLEVPTNFGVRFSTINPPASNTNAAIVHIPRPAAPENTQLNDDIIGPRITGGSVTATAPFSSSFGNATSANWGAFMFTEFADRVIIPAIRIGVRYNLTADSGSDFRVVAFCQFTPIYADLGGLATD